MSNRKSPIKNQKYPSIGTLKLRDVVEALPESLALQEALHFLGEAPGDEVYTLDALATAIQVSPFTLRHHMRRPEIQPHRLLHGRKYLYGAMKAIAELRKQIETR
jgi:hypothetical protein